MWDVERLGIDPCMFGAVSDSFEIFFDFVPWCAEDVFEENNGRSMFLHPAHHAVECAGRFSAIIDAFLLVIEIGVIDAGCASDEQVHIAWDWDCRAECGCSASDE